jgi:hypothetical protein
LTDISLGFVIAFSYTVEMIVAAGFKPICESAVGVQAVFYAFAAISLIGTYYVYSRVKETKGLADIDNKALYQPNNILRMTPREIRAVGRWLPKENSSSFLPIIEEVSTQGECETTLGTVLNNNASRISILSA